MTSIPNPYSKTDNTTITVRISKEDAEYLFIENLPRQGCRQAVVSSLLHALITHLQNDPNFKDQQLTQEQYVTTTIKRIKFNSKR